MLLREAVVGNRLRGRVRCLSYLLLVFFNERSFLGLKTMVIKNAHRAYRAARSLELAARRLS